MPTITRQTPVAPSRTGSATSSAPAPASQPTAAPANKAWTAAPAPVSAPKDGFTSGPTTTTVSATAPGPGPVTRALPATATLDPERLAVAKAKYGEAAGQRLAAWSELMESVKELPEREKVQRIHDFITVSAAYATDSQHFGQSDYWATPTELLGTGEGDCEDFALIRYASLRQAGVPMEQLQLAYVKARTGESHMVLVYREASGGAPWVLDNLEADMLRTPGRPDLMPVFGFNEEHLWITASLGDTTGKRMSPGSVGRFQEWLRRVGEGE